MIPVYCICLLSVGQDKMVGLSKQPKNGLILYAVFYISEKKNKMLFCTIHFETE